MRGDHTLFTTAEGIERLWEVSVPLLETPPPVRLYPPGAWGPKSIHQLVAPHAWRLPFERAWRGPRPTGGRGGFWGMGRAGGAPDPAGDPPARAGRGKLVLARGLVSHRPAR